MHWNTLSRLITAQWEGMGDVGSARYELVLLRPCSTIRVLSYITVRDPPTPKIPFHTELILVVGLQGLSKTS